MSPVGTLMAHHTRPGLHFKSVKRSRALIVRPRLLRASRLHVAAGTTLPGHLHSLCRKSLAAVVPVALSLCITASCLDNAPAVAHNMQPALGTSAPTCTSLEGSAARLDAYGDLGGFHHRVVTSSADAQRLFDQGG
jgi:hypothetical protein